MKELEEEGVGQEDREKLKGEQENEEIEQEENEKANRNWGSWSRGTKERGDSGGGS